MNQLQQKTRARKGGFTLVEIIVVLSIAALLSSLVFASFKSVNEGNKKTSCQTNLRQIYQALRLYGQDFNGEFPSYNPAGYVSDRPAAGLGLWALYAYPKQGTGANLDCDGRTTQLPPTDTTDNNQPLLASYIKSPNAFHCPYDRFSKKVEASTECGVAAATELQTDVLTYNGSGNVSRFNPFYNSYQTQDDIGATAVDKAPYSSFRAPASSRQLVYYKQQANPSEINARRRTPDTAVVTWCRFHRKLGADGATTDANSANNSDNVLFMDGTVRFLPTKQMAALDCSGWTRIPEETVEGYLSTNPTACPK